MASLRRPSRASRAWPALGPAAILAFLLGAAPATAQLPQLSPACDLGCPPVQLCAPWDTACQEQSQAALGCHAEQTSCMTKLTIFNGYITQLGLGVPLHSLPPLYREILDPLYPTANVSEWGFGYSNRQPPDNATNPCERCYFSNSAYVVKLQNGDLDQASEFRLLLHEIQHFEQCMQVGGYDYFAKMWWDHLSETELQSMDMKQIHDQMQMEQDAASKAEANWNLVKACCIHPSSGKLIRPLAVSSMQMSQASVRTGDTVELAVGTENGATPLSFEWSVRAPGSGSFTSLPASSAGPDRATWTPSVVGSHELRVRVGQAPGPHNTFAPVPVTRTVIVQGDVQGDDDALTGPVDLGPLLRELQYLELVQRAPDGRAVDGGTVCLSCPRDFTMTGIRQVLERAGVQESVTVHVYDGRRALVADLGTYSPTRGSFSAVPATQRVSPRGEFRDAAAGCGYKLVVTGARGRPLGETDICLERR